MIPAIMETKAYISVASFCEAVIFRQTLNFLVMNPIFALLGSRAAQNIPKILS